MKAGREIRRVVRFSRLNLNDASYDALGAYDIIFCRNVLIYFDTTSRTAVIGRLLAHLEPQGYLFLGHSETLSGITTELHAVAPAIYERTRLPVAKGLAETP
jgi:chemotaxis protein methyltransferase CheR